METVICPWCNQSNRPSDFECRKCSRLLTPLGLDLGPGPNPPMPPRTLPKGYRWKMLVSNSFLSLGGSIFLLVGLPLGVVFTLIGLAPGMWVMIAIGGGLGFGFSAIGGVMLYYGIRRGMSKVRPYQQGHVTLGRIIDLYPEVSISVNNQHPWTIVYDYEVHGVGYEGKFISWHRLPQNSAIGSRIYILYSPDDPDESVIYPPV